MNLDPNRDLAEREMIDREAKQVVREHGVYRGLPRPRREVLHRIEYLSRCKRKSARFRAVHLRALEIVRGDVEWPE